MSMLPLLLFCSVYGFLSASEDVDEVTCGSVVKLRNTRYLVQLHSHEVQYGSGSGQQSVTGVDNSDDVNSYWVATAATGQHCTRGEPFECGATLRFLHSATQRYLHSHHFQSPISHQQEISAFGKDGEGDTGDNWVLICSEDVWMRENPVMFRHKDTGMYLCVSGKKFGRPIAGQMEVVGGSSPDSSCKWRVQEGVYIKPSRTPEQTSSSSDRFDRDEL